MRNAQFDDKKHAGGHKVKNEERRNKKQKQRRKTSKHTHAENNANKTGKYPQESA